MDLPETPPPSPEGRRIPSKAFIGIAVAALAALALAALGGERSPPQALPEPVPALTTPAAVVPTQAEDRWVEWEASQGTGQFQFTDFDVEISATRQDDLDAAKITVRSRDGASTELIGDGLPWGAAAKIAVVRLTPTALPTLLVSTFSGGAHCCTSVIALDLHEGRWRRTDLGQWDGDSPALPTDLDGDALKEFEFIDQSFLYAFAPYADSWAPPVVLQVVDGGVRDISNQASFRPVFKRAAERSREACEARSNGACAAFVAASARAGDLDDGWTLMLSSYDQQSDWTLPTPCRIRVSGTCPAGAELTFATYPEALQWFLGEEGYLPKAYVEPLAAAGPSFSCAAAARPLEQTICADERLSRLDRMLAVAFTRALALTPNRAALRATQRTFIADRNTAADPADLTALYEQRIRQLLAVDETP